MTPKPKASMISTVRRWLELREDLVTAGPPVQAVRPDALLAG